MPANPLSKVSAQVVLAPESGASIGPNTPITSRNIEQFRPSPEAARTIRETLAGGGFEVGPLVANSFSIAAPVNTFEDFFKTKLRKEASGGLVARSHANDYALELPLGALPDGLKKHLIAITFTRPPDFGPTGY
ncbi:MAG: hypothetical protein QOJ42_455 [Acidobacteriaceae bacterium]|jgi:hypothetical protein|nr:hypothetical protein [Acidobacteriaceae bacterium]MDX6464640.1 hypothetical protein [Acidobacteriaceae bacterium]